MARRPSKHTRPARPLRNAQTASSAQKTDGLWVVRIIRAERAVKSYTCPQCSTTILPGTAHIVAWPHTPPIGASSGVEYRRHFHTDCWRRRR